MATVDHLTLSFSLLQIHTDLVVEETQMTDTSVKVNVTRERVTLLTLAQKNDFGKIQEYTPRLVNKVFKRIEKEWSDTKPPVMLAAYREESITHLKNDLKQRYQNSRVGNFNQKLVFDCIDRKLAYAKDIDSTKEVRASAATLFRATLIPFDLIRNGPWLLRDLHPEVFSTENHLAYAKILVAKFLEKNPSFNKPEYLSNIQLAAVLLSYNLNEHIDETTAVLLKACKKQIPPTEQPNQYCTVAILNAMLDTFVEQLDYKVTIFPFLFFQYRLTALQQLFVDTAQINWQQLDRECTCILSGLREADLSADELSKLLALVESFRSELSKSALEADSSELQLLITKVAEMQKCLTFRVCCQTIEQFCDVHATTRAFIDCFDLATARFCLSNSMKKFFSNHLLGSNSLELQKMLRVADELIILSQPVLGMIGYDIFENETYCLAIQRSACFAEYRDRLIHAYFQACLESVATASPSFSRYYILRRLPKNELCFECIFLKSDWLPRPAKQLAEEDRIRALRGGQLPKLADGQSEGEQPLQAADLRGIGSQSGLNAENKLDIVQIEKTKEMWKTKDTKGRIIVGALYTLVETLLKGDDHEPIISSELKPNAKLMDKFLKMAIDGGLSEKSISDAMRCLKDELLQAKG